MIGKKTRLLLLLLSPTTDKSAVATAGAVDKEVPVALYFGTRSVDGLQDWKTWAVLGLLLCWTWSRFVVAGV
jgi:hypothetical protein